MGDYWGYNTLHGDSYGNPIAYENVENRMTSGFEHQNFDF